MCLEVCPVSSGIVGCDCSSSCPSPLVTEDCVCSMVTVALIIDSYGVYNLWLHVSILTSGVSIVGWDS